MPNLSDKRVVDLLEVGVSWLQAAARDPNGWMGNGVIRTLVAANAMDRAVLIATSRLPGQRLVREAVGRSQFVPARGLNAQQRQELMAGSEKHFLVLTDDTIPRGNMIFMPNGYPLMVTAAGMAHARTVEADLMQIAPALSRDGFTIAWNQYRQQMRGMRARFRDG